MATATTVVEPNVKIGPTKLLINGKWVDSASGKNVPYDQSVYGRG